MARQRAQWRPAPGAAGQHGDRRMEAGDRPQVVLGGLIKERLHPRLRGLVRNGRALDERGL